MLTIQQKAQCVLWHHNLKLPTAVQRNLEMSLDKTLLTLTTLRDGLKILWKLAAFWIAKDRVGQAAIFSKSCSARVIIRLNSLNNL